MIHKYEDLDPDGDKIYYTFWFDETKVTHESFGFLIRSTNPGESYVKNYLHNEYEPAYIVEYKTYYKAEVYLLNGMIHNLNGPAIIYYNRFDKNSKYFITSKKFYILDVELHKSVYKEAIEYYINNGPTAFRLMYR